MILTTSLLGKIIKDPGDADKDDSVWKVDRSTYGSGQHTST